MKFLATAALAATLAFAGAARADDNHNHGDSRAMAEAPFAYATPAGAKAGGAFISIENYGPADRLVGARSDVAVKTEIHEHIMDGGVMKMRAVEGGVALPENGRIEMKSGGYHVMMMGLKQPLAEGETIRITLEFESGMELPLDVPVVARGKEPKHAHD